MYVSPELSMVLILPDTRFSAMSNNLKKRGDNMRVPKRTISDWVLSTARPALQSVYAENNVRAPCLDVVAVPRCNMM